ncbi:MAG: porin [Desulfovibrionaceae bacterium]|jgi:predicted porin|nr:porin [Desulfovibrionaceae bacterium]
MKKSLIALAVLGLSGAAMAQSASPCQNIYMPCAATGASSVTLYGKADAGLGKIANGGLKTTPSDTATTGDNSNKTQFLSGSTMNAFDSRVGVRGVEDMGGGLRAGYWFETGLDLNNGAQANPTFWARIAHMWIGGDWGTVRLGRQYAPSYLTTLAYDLTTTANYSVLGTTYKYVTLGPRINSGFSYFSPTFNGLTGAVAFVSKNDCPTANCGKNAWDAALMYAMGPVNVGASVNKLSGGKTGYQLGGKYDFGNFLVAASYNQSAQLANVKAVRRGFELGGTAKFGAFSVTLDLTRDTKNDWGGKKYTNGLLELKYSLSKRTFLYGAYLRSDKTNNYGIGIDHNF